jgi:MoxR-like ATPase
MSPVQEFAGRLIGNVERVIVGKREQLEHVVIALLCQGHVLIDDVPGTGKTMLARALAASFGGDFKRLQCTPDLLPNDVTGVSVFDQRDSTFEFRPGPVFVNVLVADEVNRATPRTQAALLEAMEERQVTVDGVTHALPRPFVVLATQNPIELEGTFPLPEAQIDRFLMRVVLGHASPEAEVEVLERVGRRHPIDDVAAVTEPAEVLALADEVAAVHLEPTLSRYIVDLARATRAHRDVALGASTRGSIALHRTARARAAVQGRDFTLPDDIKAMAPLTLAHRVVLKPQSRLRGRTADDVVAEILGAVPLELT